MTNEFLYDNFDNKILSIFFVKIFIKKTRVPNLSYFRKEMAYLIFSKRKRSEAKALNGFMTEKVFNIFIIYKEFYEFNTLFRSLIMI